MPNLAREFEIFRNKTVLVLFLQNNNHAIYQSSCHETLFARNAAYTSVLVRQGPWNFPAAA
jgi:hypothetical protein